MIQLFNVSKVFTSGVAALRDVNVHIQKGEFVFLVGPSGAGKSTFLRLLFRDELPSSGQIIIDGRNIERLRPSKVPYLRRSMGIVFQDFKLVDSKTVFDNVAFALRVTDAPYEQIGDRTHRVLNLLGLTHKAKMTPYQLSGGEKQRVCIARALVNDPAILLTDEPTGNLDPELSLEIMELFLEINKRGTTVVVATHDSQLVDRLQRRVIRVQDGNIVSDVDRGSYNG